MEKSKIENKKAVDASAMKVSQKAGSVENKDQAPKTRNLSSKGHQDLATTPAEISPAKHGKQTTRSQ